MQRRPLSVCVCSGAIRAIAPSLINPRSRRDRGGLLRTAAEVASKK